MPELPEVETIRNDLREMVVGRRIERARVLDPRLVRHPSGDRFEAELAGQRVEAVDRRAKYLLFRLSSRKTMVVQLIITGQLLLVDPEAPIRKSVRLILDLDDGRQLRLVDSSYLARVHLLDADELQSWPPLKKLGPEAISDEFTLEYFRRLLRSTRRQIKAVLLDQSGVSGLGNIYTDESLFAARIHPLRPANSLSPEEVERLYLAIRTILREAIALRGTTTRSYRDLLGRKGGYQERLKVVARAGKPCIGCSGTVERIWVAGRETYLCPSCQLLEVPKERAA
ncbi:MAG: DNA-formamidopyrimidine glycosylase [Sphingomonadaceae bacterium]